MKPILKKCRYKNCCHSIRDIDISVDKYVANGSAYYHEDCYALKKEEDETAKNTKTCHYSHCKHDSKEIDIRNEPYKLVGNFYYHKDCYKEKANGDWKDEQTKKNLQLIRDLWYENISKEVSFSQLMQILNRYVEAGVDSEYLLFTLKYVISHNMRLNYPNGFKYYVDRREIKDAYNKSKIGKIDKSAFSVDADIFSNPPNDNETNHKIINKPKGFESIIKRRED